MTVVEPVDLGAIVRPSALLGQASEPPYHDGWSSGPGSTGTSSRFGRCPVAATRPSKSAAAVARWSQTLAPGTVG